MQPEKNLTSPLQRLYLMPCAPRQLDNEPKKMRGKAVSVKAIFVLGLASFLAGSLFTSRIWTSRSTTSHNKNHPTDLAIPNHASTKLGEVARDFDHKRVSFNSKF